MWNACNTCSGTAARRTPARPWAGRELGGGRDLRERCRGWRRRHASSSHPARSCTPTSATEGALIDYGERYRAAIPISASRAEGAVNHLLNARMNQRKQMRWISVGAHRVLQVRAAVLDGRYGLGHQAIQLAA